MYRVEEHCHFAILKLVSSAISMCEKQSQVYRLFHTSPPLHTHSVVRALIRYQVDTIVDEDEESNTPLHLACTNGHLQVAKVLIEAHAEVEAR